jgi:hypothetical protein
MIDWCSKFRWWGAMAVLSCSGLIISSARGQGALPRQPIEFSQPKGSETLTNFSRSTAPSEGMKQLESDLSKTANSFSPQSSLDGVLPSPRWVPSGSAVQSRRVKELLEQRKNWIFMNPEEMLSAPKAKDIFNLPEYGADGTEKTKTTALERYFSNLDRPKRTARSSGWFREDDAAVDRVKPKPREEDASRDDNDLPTGLRESEQNLKKLFEGESTPSARSSLADIFGVGDTKSSAMDQHPLRKSFMDDFKKIYGTSPGSSAGVLNNLGTSADPSTAPAGLNRGLDAFTTSMPRPEAADTMSAANARLLAPRLPDLNAQALTQWNPLQVPKLEQPAPRLTPLSSGIVEFPRRKF